MNEKTRLKGSDEILSSLGKRARRPSTQEGSGTHREGEDGQNQDKDSIGEEAKETVPAEMDSSPLPDAEQIMILDEEPRSKRKRNRRAPMTEEELGQRERDANPLDFAKYKLPTPKPRKEEPKPAVPKAESKTAAPADPKVESEPVELPIPETPKSEAPEPPPPSLLEDESTRSRFMADLSNQFERQFTQRFRQRNQRSAAEIMERVAEEMGIPSKNKEQPPEQPEQQKQEQFAPQSKPVPPVPEPKIQPEIKVIASQPKAADDSFQEETWEVIQTKTAEAVTKITPEDEQTLQLEAESFLKNFVEETQQQEAVQAQDFKETLAEKFMRERERYLRELGIAEEIEREQERQAVEEIIADQTSQAAPLPVSGRRVLDFQIDPEMHMKEGERPPVRPVTYGRNGETRPLDQEEEPPIRRIGKQEETPPDKKSAEQLLLELAVSKTIASAPFQVEPPPAKKTVAKPKPAAVLALQESRNGPAEVERQLSKKKSKGKASLFRLRTVLLFAGVMLTLGVAGFFVNFFWSPGGEEGGSGYIQGGITEADNYQAWESRSFSGGALFGSVSIKKSGITLENMTVERTITVEDLSSSEPITLRNVSSDKIRFLTGNTTALELDNVQAKELVIENANGAVEVRLSGNSQIDKVEVFTSAQLSMSEGAQAAIGEIELRGEQSMDTIRAELTGFDTVPLVASGGETMLVLNETPVNTMTARGTLKVEGNGTVRSLSAEQLEDTPLVLSLNVPVTNLNLKNEADISVGSVIDNAFTGNHLKVGGDGSIASMVINDEGAGTRLEVDLSSFRIQHLTANTRTRVDSAGTSQINTLTANDSVYIMGNKVNRLVANADGVYYENRPDEIPNVNGINPPQSVADNTHINFGKAAVEEALATDTTNDPTATTCNHSRDEGGFLRGNGSADNPFEISTAAQLAHMNYHLNAYFMQTADIDITDDSRFASGFTPIASEGTSFSGVYDGGGYQIKNLRISSAGENVGLFASNTGTIHKVHIMSGEIAATSTGSRVGAVVGFNSEGGTVSACANGAIISGSSFAGGLVGYNYGGRVQDCYNYAKISSNGTAGGLVGLNRASGVVASSYNVGTMEGEGVFGAIAGDNESATVTNCYFLKDTAATAIGSGNGTAMEVTSDELQGEQIIMDLSVGSTDSPWIRGSGSYTYPMLNAQHTVIWEGIAEAEEEQPSAGEQAPDEGEAPQPVSIPEQQPVFEVP